MKASFIFLLALTAVTSARADVKLPALFSDHMVVQADAAVPVWGWAAWGEEVTKADTNGKVDGNDLLAWSAHAPNPQALRYAWAENPIISMENGAGLPLRPFQVGLKKKRN